MSHRYHIQNLNISSDWAIRRNALYNVAHTDNILDADKYDYIYHQEDMLYLTKMNYHLDLGWYGYDDLASPLTGYCIHLFRGKNWNNAELLEKFHSKSLNVILTQISVFTYSVNIGEYENLIGYRVDEDDPLNQNDFSSLNTFSAKHTI